jgi:hypothetical protein
MGYPGVPSNHEARRGLNILKFQIAKGLGTYVVSTCSSSSKEMLESLHVDEVGFNLSVI